MGVTITSHIKLMMIQTYTLICDEGEDIQGKVILGNIDRIRRDLLNVPLHKCGNIKECDFFFDMDHARMYGHGWKYFFHIILLRKSVIVFDKRFG